MSAGSIYGLFIIIFFPLLVWVAISTRTGKNSMAAAAKLKDTYEPGAVTAYVAMYESIGQTLLAFGDETLTVRSKDGVVATIPSGTIQQVLYSRFGFFHIVTAEKTYKFAYLHNMQEAGGLYGKIFGGKYRSKRSIQEFLKDLDMLRIPYKEVPQKEVIFLAQQKI